MGCRYDGLNGRAAVIATLSAAELRERFLIALDQYNRHLNFCVDISQKLSVAVLVADGFLNSIHDPGAAMDARRWSLVVVLVATTVAYLWMMRQYHERCDRARATLEACEAAIAPFALADIGVMPHVPLAGREHSRIIAVWAGVFLAVVALSMIYFTGYRPTW